MIINLKIFFKTKTATTTTAAKVTTTANCTTKTSPSKTSTNITQQVQTQQSQTQSQQTIQRSSGTASGTVTIATTPAQPTKNAIVVANTGQIVQSAQVCINPYFYKILSKRMW